MSEPGTALCKKVEIGRLNYRVTGYRQAVAPLLIGVDQNYVRMIHIVTACPLKLRRRGLTCPIKSPSPSIYEVLTSASPIPVNGSTRRTIDQPETSFNINQCPHFELNDSLFSSLRY